MEGNKNRVCPKARDYLLCSVAAKTRSQTETSRFLRWQQQQAMDAVTPAESPSRTSEPFSRVHEGRGSWHSTSMAPLIHLELTPVTELEDRDLNLPQPGTAANATAGSPFLFTQTTGKWKFMIRFSYCPGMWWSGHPARATMYIGRGSNCNSSCPANSFENLSLSISWTELAS